MTPPIDFYELERRQKFRSLGVVALLLAFHLAAVGVLMLAGWLTFGLFAARPLSSGFWLKFVAADFVFAGAIAAIHFFDARKNGAAYLLKRLSAKPPDPSDRYHRQFADAVEAIRLASGIPRLNALILPTFSVNSLALIQPGGTPAVAVTEGLLAECSRDEIEAVVAHEAAHIARGDTTILTLVCGLTSFFERLRDSLEPEIEPAANAWSRGRTSRGSAGLLYIAAFLSTGMIRLLGVFVFRERELLADAAAVEFGRSPMALARAVFKARARNVFIGDFGQAYAPLFLIAPSIAGEAGAPVPRWSSTHPPFEERIRLLAGMAHLTPQAVAEQVRESRENRKNARTITETMSPADELPARAGEKSGEIRDWILVRRGGGETHPLSLGELVENSDFSPAVRIRNLTEGLAGLAGDFPQIRDALRRKRLGRPVDPARLHMCPRCRIPLGSSIYEGVPIGICRRCGGKSVDVPDMNRIIARREVGFSRELEAKASAFRQKRLLDPSARGKESPGREERLTCPGCGCLMRSRPYNYQYFIPVDKCLSCGRIWFDSDELEILQILIEETRTD